MGEVKVYANGKEVLVAKVDEGTKKATFAVKAGEKIEVRDEGAGSIMRLNSLQFASCGQPSQPVCDHTKCVEWDCSQWCACYDDAKLSVYEHHNCVDDDEPCICQK